MRTFRIGARKSALSTAQVSEAVRLLSHLDRQLRFETTGIDNPGDIDLESSLSSMEGTDFFTRGLDDSLLDGTIDIAVHSAKDLPDNIPQGVKIAAITKCIDYRDAIVLGRGYEIKGGKGSIVDRLPAGTVVGTSSKRRAGLITRTRSDIKIKDIRGAVDQRLKQLDSGMFDAIVLAAAGLKRLGLEDRISGYLDGPTAPLQGRLALAVREQDSEAASITSLLDDRPNWGIVHIAGAGPGDPELASVKTIRLLNSCDVVVYDRLAPYSLLEGLNCEKIYAGKAKGSHTMEQEDINELLVRLAIAGRDVVRLKGGDPLIFGRGFEEVEYLRSHFVKYTIVPGITSALAVAAYTEIPLTKRGGSRHVTLADGHDAGSVFMPGPGTGGTVVYYMGASSIDEIASALIKNGAPADLPAAVVSKASLPGQRIHEGTLKSFCNRAHYASPALFIVGAHGPVNDRGWFAAKKKVLFTGTNPERYRGLGEITKNTMIDLKPKVKRITAASLKRFNCVIFTSSHGVKYFFEALYSGKADARALQGKKVFSVGAVTSAEILKYGIKPDIQAAFESAEGLLKAISGKSKGRLNALLPCSALSHDTLADGLKKLGHSARKLPVYGNTLPGDVQKLDISEFDTLVFTSPSTVKNFVKVYGGIPEGKQIVTTGDVTKKAVQYASVRSV
jgi:uroporphyrinogen III methyltransferase/synthase